MTTQAATPGILSARYIWITLGACALVFLGAFESLAVTTIMPVVSADLHGADLYALTFAGPLATGVIGMVAAGNWSDRRGPVAPLYISVVLFVTGLIVSGTAATMELFVAGRLAQGLGSGAMTVALYVVVARVYPPALHAKIFAGFAAAWVIPSLIGPFAAGAVTELLSWHWVFLGVVGLVAAAMLMVVPALRALDPEPDGAGLAPWAFGRLAWAAIAALAVLGLSLLGAVPALGLAAVVVALVAVRPLLPRGTLVARRGLPSVILVRGLVSAAFLGAEVYLPYLFIDRYDFSPALAGLALSGGALAWSVASAVQGRLGERMPDASSIRIGTVLLLMAIVLALATSLLAWPPAAAIGGWLLGGAGMGLMYPRLSVRTLALSAPDHQGFNSSALSIADSLGGALSLAATGIVFAAFAGAGSFGGVFALTATIAVLAVLLASRVAAKGGAAEAGVDPQAVAAASRIDVDRTA